MKIRNWLSNASEKLAAAGIESANMESQLLLADDLSQSRSWVLAHSEDEVDITGLEEKLNRRLNHEPLAYILGWREFYGRKFAVRPGVLIPRHETEILVEASQEYIKPGSRVLEIGTGSGCVAITLKLECDGADIVSVDISEDALLVAEENARVLAADVKFLLSDNVSAIPTGTKFDLIVSNPPYISLDYPLDKEVKDFEPAGALFGGEDGLDFYRRIAQEVKGYLADDGVLLLEIGFDQAVTVHELFEEQGWKFVRSWVDLSGVVRVLGFSSPL